MASIENLAALQSLVAKFCELKGEFDELIEGDEFMTYYYENQFLSSWSPLLGELDDMVAAYDSEVS